MESHEMTPLPPDLSDQLSSELYDRIIDHLHSFKHSLFACSIVCRSWLPASRYHLFLDVNLTPNLVRFLLSSPHAMETITPYLRDVTLGGAWIAEQRCEFDIVISFLLNLENSRGLHLETWSWDFLSHASRDLLLRSEGDFFQNVTNINMKYIHFPSSSLLLEFISRFPMLRSLSFDNVTWNSDEDRHSPQISGEAQSRIRRPLHLTKLYVRSCLLEPILYWFFGDHIHHDVNGQGLSRPAIRVLALPEILPREFDIVGRVLRSLGSILQHLELGFLAHNADELADHGKAVRTCFHGGYAQLRHIQTFSVWWIFLITPICAESMSIN
jgi:hypothetical protein